MKSKGNGKLTAVSRADLQEASRLEVELATCKATIVQCQRRIVELTADCERLVSAEVNGGQVDPSRLPGTMEEIEGRKRKIAAYEARCSTLESRIKALRHSTPSKARERAKNQDLLGKLVTKRLKGYGAIRDHVEQLRQLLQAHTDLTVRMQEVASLLGMRISLDALNGGRFDALLNSLPERESIAEAEQWARWFLGKEPTKTYTVPRSVTFPETLWRIGIYEAGERALLTDAEARSLFAPPKVALAPARPKPETTKEASGHGILVRPATHGRTLGHMVMGEEAGIVA